MTTINYHAYHQTNSVFETAVCSAVQCSAVQFSAVQYRFTSAFLFLSTALLALNNFFGDEIKCFAEEKAASKAVNQFCFITGTFTVPGREDDRLLEGEEVTVHNYYQWVAYILVVQGVLFLLPHQLWSAMEDGRVGRMIKEIQAPGRMVKELQAAGKVEDAAKAASEVVKKENEVIKNIASFIHSQGKAGSNGKTKSGPILRRYVLSFLLCHFLTIVNVLLNITLVDAFFGGRFASFGMRWMTAEDGWNALPDVFPRRAGCIWREHGTGGDVQNVSYLCYLATNVATEKVFVFMWFWFLSLVPTSLGTFLYYSALLLTRDEAWRTYCLRITEPRDTCELGPCWVEAVVASNAGPSADY
jgi:hypothetical protein